MTQQIHDKQRLLVAVSKFNGAALILAAQGGAALYEIEQMSADPDEWGELEESRPKEPPGIYVWEGRIITEDGHGMGEYGGMGDPDFEWQGAWRRANVRDLIEFGFYALALQSAKQNATHEAVQLSPSGLQILYVCPECKAPVDIAGLDKIGVEHPTIHRVEPDWKPALEPPSRPLQLSIEDEQAAQTLRFPSAEETRACSWPVEDAACPVHGAPATVTGEKDPDFGKAVEDAWLQPFAWDDGLLTPYVCRCGEMQPMSLAAAREHVRQRHAAGDLDEELRRARATLEETRRIPLSTSGAPFAEAPEDEWLRPSPADTIRGLYVCRCGQIAPATLPIARHHVRQTHGADDRPLDTPPPEHCEATHRTMRCQFARGHAGLHSFDAPPDRR